MRMSCSGWVSGGAAPPMVLAPPDSLAYRRYLRFLPSQEESGGKFLALEGAEGLGPQGRLVDLRRQGEAGYEHEGVQYQNPKNGSSGTAEIEGGKLGDKVADVSVSSRVQQYTAMLRARHSAQYNTPLQTSRSCSSIVFRSSRRSLFFRSAEGHESSGKEGPDESGCESSRNGSVDSGEGEAAFSPRYRSFSLPWPSDPTWRWSSDPNITSMAGVQSSAFGSVGGRRASDQHSASLVRLDSATSDEGCPRDGSTGPTPPPSPVFRLSAANHLMGLITPFKSLSPASSMGSHLGSVEDLPLMRSRSLGHVPDHWARSHSADSAVEVEEESTIVSPALSPAVPPADAPEALSGYLAGGEQVNGGPEAGVSGTCDACSDERKLAAAERGQCSDGKCPADGPCVPNGDIVFGESDGESHAYCDCNENCEKDVSVVRESVDDCLRTVELRKKLGQSGNRRERRHGGVNGEVLFRHARACGVVQSPEDREAAGKKVLRTPSVVISDHSGDTISLTVALASSDFSIDQLGKMEKLRESASPTLSAGDDNASRKVSSCSSCSSVSTVDMTTPLTTISLDSLIEVPNRRISDCSTCSNVTASEDEVEHELSRPPPPRKPSNWRKLRSIVQWTPFIQTYKKHKYPWVQLAGHQGNFLAGYKQGTILKKLCPAEEKALEAIKKDILRPYVPTYMGVVEGTDGERYLQLQDLLSDFTLPCVMDIKMGVRTYLEDELAKAREKPKLRKDMYEKMVQIDPKAPTEAENRAKAVTKPRYMVWRETISSTATQGFRIEGMRRGDGTSSKDFKTTRTREQVLASLNSFLQGYPHAASRYVQQLKSIKATLEASAFFKTHELIGSSLLFVHNESSASVKLIDFAKTIPLPENVEITHRKPWSEGTHEDGYLLGLDNLIDLFSVIEKNLNVNDAITKTGTPTTTTNATTPEETSSNTSSAHTTNTTTNTSSSNSNSTST